MAAVPRIHVPSAVAAARESTPAGPALSPADAQRLVDDMREAAETSFDLMVHAQRFARDREDAVRERAAANRILVVDRLGWVKANALMLSQLVADSAEPTSLPRTLGLRTRLAGWGSQAEARANGAELGTVLGLLSRSVLGQYEPLRRPGTLLLNAPTIVQTEAALEAEPRDFRLWVALHETAHRVQLAAAPWLRTAVIDRIAALIRTEDVGREALRRLPAALRSGTPLAEVVLTESGQRTLAELTAIMTLLEGHADVMTDRVGRRLIPSAGSIRAAFTASRPLSGLRGTVLSLLGAQSKLAQYDDGAAFVRRIIADAGLEGFNRVWDSLTALPSAEELKRPELWLERLA